MSISLSTMGRLVWGIVSPLKQRIFDFGGGESPYLNLFHCQSILHDQSDARWWRDGTSVLQNSIVSAILCKRRALAGISAYLPCLQTHTSEPVSVAEQHLNCTVAILDIASFHFMTESYVYSLPLSTIAVECRASSVKCVVTGFGRTVAEGVG